MRRTPEGGCKCFDLARFGVALQEQYCTGYLPQSLCKRRDWTLFEERAFLAACAGAPGNAKVRRRAECPESITQVVYFFPAKGQVQVAEESVQHAPCPAISVNCRPRRQDPRVAVLPVDRPGDRWPARAPEVRRFFARAVGDAAGAALLELLQEAEKEYFIAQSLFRVQENAATGEIGTVPVGVSKGARGRAFTPPVPLVFIPALLEISRAEVNQCQVEVDTRTRLDLKRAPITGNRPVVPPFFSNATPRLRYASAYFGSISIARW